MILDQQTLKAAHRHSATNRGEVLGSNVCGCFYCESVFAPSSIEEWIEETQGNYSNAPDPFTAMCPECGMDTVLGDQSQLPVTDPAFLHAMRKEWFGVDDLEN